MAERSLSDGPQNDDELHAYIKSEFDVDIPRVAVCEGHVAPFKFIADLYFERVSAALALAARGTSKTFGVALLHFINSTFKPGCGSLTFAATEGQGRRCVAADTLIDCLRDHRQHPLGVPISQIEPGQLVWTFNEADWKFELKRIIDVWKVGRKPVWKVVLNNGFVLRTTSDHKYMRRDGKWAELKDLSVGDSMKPAFPGFKMMIENIEQSNTEEEVWDMSVEDNHNFVAHGIVLHNCYSNIEDWCYVHDEASGRRTDTVKPFIRDKPLKSNTTWKTGSVTEIVAGSTNAVSGPHAAKAHADEVDLMEHAVWVQSRGIAVSNRATGPLPKWMQSFKGMIPPQDIVTSTRNSTKGLMQELLDEIEEDERNGNIPQLKLYCWCIWESIAQIPNCRGANEHERRAACIQAGLPADSLCDCNRVVKGVLENGEPRTLEKICDGKAFLSRGWKPEIDLISTFKRNTPGTWKLQHECGVGKDENNYIEDWSLAQYGVTNYDPNPLYGPIYQGVDWGDTNPHCVLWFQYLTCQVPTTGFEEEPTWLMPGTYVLFREIYKAGMATDRLANLVIDTENQYRMKYPNWKVKSRFCDPQGAGDRRIFHNHGLRSSWPVKTRNKETMIDVVQNLVIDGRLFVDFRNAPVWSEEIEVWGKNPKTGKEINKFNHAMSAFRYCIANAEILESKNRFEDNKNKPIRGTKAANQIPIYSQAGERDMFKAGPVATRGGSQVIIDPQFTLKH